MFTPCNVLKCILNFRLLEGNDNDIEFNRNKK